jgi:hypothetical protein
MDQFAPATAVTTFQVLMEIPDSVCGKSKCRKEHQEHKAAICDQLMGTNALTKAYRLKQLTGDSIGD